MNAVSVRFLGLAPAQAAIFIIVAATALRFFYCVWLPLLPDEAYYFQWSLHPDASYYSKGPAVAYTIAAGTALFGGNNFGIRFFAVLLSAGTAWQIFLLARRWYDDTAALLAVLITGVTPICALGAVVMTIDPLSAFFWVWAACHFSRAVQEDRLFDWVLAGFATGSGFLAKYLNALELVSFLFFLLLVPARRDLLLRRGFWLMLAVAVLCTLPVWWWNGQHGWVSFIQLRTRGKLNGSFDLHGSTFLDFLVMQALVISPLLFLALMGTVLGLLARRWGERSATETEGDLFMLLLFLPVFLLYAVLACHFRGEPNWPAISYLSLIIVLASYWLRILASRRMRLFVAAAFLLAWIQTVLMHNPEILPLPPKLDPMSRVAGWSQIAAELGRLQQEQQADVLIADAYKEAAIFSFYLPGHEFIYTLRHQPPATQYDFWPSYPMQPPHRALWITGEATPAALQRNFNTITPLERVVVSFRGHLLREYMIYRCENK
ncbi:MAG TPA: glycosyltransferase family 39 protein [Candidatus Methylacidiphilales bacterium]|nr:glycosyltransferase family 39 protein [Candidatus Methylacidiphilales bacterium]